MDRRSFLASALGVSAATPVVAAVSADSPVLRDKIASAELGLRNVAGGDQSRMLQHLLDSASDENRQVFLPAGSYLVSDLNLPARTRLAGVPGATRLVFAGGGHMIAADRAEHVSLTGLTIDGAGRQLDDYVPGLLHLAESRNITIENCVFEGGIGSGIALDRCSGRVSGTTIRRMADVAIRAVESTGLSITGNIVEDCGNGGIIVQRWTKGEDGSMVSGNRVIRIRADDGGTGQNGNGINVFRADGVSVANNHVSDCAFSAIRANSASNVRITGNTCLRSGEVALYSEFSFEGAVIANNIIDRAMSGISVVNFDDGGRMAAVSGNIIRDLGWSPVGQRPSERDGIGIAVEADTAVTGNVIEGTPTFAMRIGWGPYLRDVTATGNVIRNARIGIAVSVVEEAGTALISDNLISGSRQGAIIGMRWGERASGDLARRGADQFRHLQIDRNRIS